MSPLLGLVLPLALWPCPNGMGVPTPAGAEQAGGAAAPRPAAITALVIAPDAPLLFAGAGDGTLRRGELGPGEPAPGPVGKLPGAIVGLAAGPGGLAVAVSDAGHLGLLEAGAAEPRRIGRHEAGALALALVPADPEHGQPAARAVVAGCDGKLSVWDLARGEQTALLSGHEGPVVGLAVAPDRLWSAGWDGTLRSWKLNGTATKGTKLALGTRELAALSAAPGGERLLVAGFDGALAWLDPASKKPAPRPVGARPNAEWIRALAFSPRGKRAVAVAHAESLLLLLDPERGLVASLTEAKTPCTAAFTPDGRELIVGRFDGTFGRVELPPEGRDEQP